MASDLDPTTLLVCFEDVTDPRIDRNKLHELINIVTIALCAVLGNADTWEDIVEFGREKEQWL